MNQPSITDIIGLLALIGAAVFSKEIADVAAPYMVIIMASAIGASWSLKRREKASRADAILYFCKVCGLAVLITGFVSTAVAGWHADLTQRSLLAPVAFGIGLIGGDWNKVLPSAGRILLDYIETLIKMRGGGK